MNKPIGCINHDCAECTAPKDYTLIHNDDLAKLAEYANRYLSFYGQSWKPLTLSTAGTVGINQEKEAPNDTN